MTEKEFLEKYLDTDIDYATLIQAAIHVTGKVGDQARDLQKAFDRFDATLRDLGFDVVEAQDDSEQELIDAMEASIANTMSGFGIDTVAFADEDGNDVYTIDCKPKLRFVSDE